MRVCFLTKSRLSKYWRATAISSEVPCKSIKKNHRKSISDFLQRGSSDFFCFCVFQLTIIYILKGSIWFQCVRSKMMQFFRGGVRVLYKYQNNVTHPCTNYATLCISNLHHPPTLGSKIWVCDT